MKKFLCLLVYLALTTIILSSCSGESLENYIEAPEGFVFIQGGTFVNSTSNLYGTPLIIQDFYIGIFQVTQREWIEVMGNNPSFFEDLDRPVERVSWYDAILFSNARSIMDGLEPFYNIDKGTTDFNNLSESDNLRWNVTINEGANGFRLLTEFEWEYAAGGGQLSRSYSFSGGNNLDEVGWHFRNSGDEYLAGIWHWPTLEANNGRSHPVGQKQPNELGLFDMSGNVREWVWCWFGEQVNPSSGWSRSVRGGGWVGGEDACRTYFRDGLCPYTIWEDLGFRLARSR